MLFEDVNSNMNDSTFLYNKIKKIFFKYVLNGVIGVEILLSVLLFLMKRLNTA